MTDLQNAANDLLNETKNGDKDGAQQAYNEFNDLFTANEAAIKAKAPDAHENIDNALDEVNDAINAGDFTKASTSAQEIVNEVNDAATQMAGSGDSDLPNGGQLASRCNWQRYNRRSLPLTVGGAVRKRAN